MEVRDPDTKRGLTQPFGAPKGHQMDSDATTPDDIGHRETVPLDEADPSVTDDSLQGTLLNGRYFVLDILGRGAMGVVYEALHRDLGRKVAIKVPWAGPDDAEIDARMVVEARASGKLQHPNVAMVTDTGRTPRGTLFLVMELVHGEDLSTILGRDGPLAVERGLRLAIQLCMGLEAIHDARLIHRDIKPSNVMVRTAPDGEEQVKILDLGLAKSLKRGQGVPHNLTKPHTTPGTPRYMAPEQIRADASIDHRADIYALGGVLFEMFAGRVPFEGEEPLAVCRKKLEEPAPSITTLRNDLPPTVSSIIDSMLASERNQRPQQCREIKAVLSAALDALGAGRIKQRHTSETWIVRTQRTRTALGAGALAVALGLTGIVLIWQGRADRNAASPASRESVKPDRAASIPDATRAIAADPNETPRSPAAQPTAQAPHPTDAPRAPLHPPTSAMASRAAARDTADVTAGSKTRARQLMEEASLDYQKGALLSAAHHAERAAMSGGGAKAYALLAKIYTVMERHDDARAAAEKVRSLDPQLAIRAGLLSEAN